MITPLKNESSDLELLKLKVGLLKIARIEELTGGCAATIVQAAGHVFKSKDGKVFDATSQRQYDEHAFLPEEQVASRLGNGKNRTGSTDVNITSIYEITRWVGSASSFDLSYVAIATSRRDWYIGRVRKSINGQVDFTKFARSKHPIRGLGYYPGEHEPIGAVVVLQEISPSKKRAVTITWIRGPTQVRPTSRSVLQ